MFGLLLSTICTSAFPQKAEENTVFPVVRKFEPATIQEPINLTHINTIIEFGVRERPEENPLLRVLPKPSNNGIPGVYKFKIAPFEWIAPYRTILDNRSFDGFDLGESVVDIVRENGVRRVLKSPEADAYFHDLSFRSSGFQFDLAGQIVTINVPILTLSRRRGVLEFYRGYWKEYFDGAIFWGVGARVRYRNSGYRIFNSDRFAKYDVTSDLAKSWELGFGKGEIVVEAFGLEGPFESLGKIRTRTSSAAIKELYQRFETFISSRFYEDISQVEPILIRLYSDQAAKYRSLTSTPYIPPKATP